MSNMVEIGPVGREKKKIHCICVFDISLIISPGKVHGPKVPLTHLGCFELNLVKVGHCALWKSHASFQYFWNIIFICISTCTNVTLSFLHSIVMS